MSHAHTYAPDLPLSDDSGRVSALSDQDSMLDCRTTILTFRRSGDKRVWQATRRELLVALQAEGGGIPFTALDIRAVDPRLCSLLTPVLLVRPDERDVILVSLGPFQLGAIILQDRLHLLAPTASHDLLRACALSLERLLNSTGSISPSAHPTVPNAHFSAHAHLDASMPPPFELVALESVLLGACTELHAHCAALVCQEREELSKQRVSTSVELLVQEMLNRVDELTEHAEGLDTALSILLAAGGPSSTHAYRSDLFERLCECYLDHVRAARCVLASMHSRITIDSQCANLLLDRTRNRLIKLEILASTVAAATGFGSMFAGVFGMNLPAAIFGDTNNSDYYDWLFATVALLISSLVGSIIFIVVAMLFGRSIREKCLGGATSQNVRAPYNMTACSLRLGAAGRASNASSEPSRTGSKIDRRKSNDVATLRTEQETRGRIWVKRFSQASSGPSVRWSSAFGGCSSRGVRSNKGIVHAEESVRGVQLASLPLVETATPT